MGIDKLTRRQMVGMVGAAAAVATATHASAAERAVVPAQDANVESPHLIALLAPLAPGAQLGQWRVAGLIGARAGAVTIGLESARGSVFFIDVCLRDHNGPTPPARTALCDLFVANEGDGAQPTVEEQGLAAMAVAELVRVNEHRVDLAGLMTHRARLSAFGDKVVRGLD